MQPISNRLNTLISAGIPDERAQIGGDLPIESPNSALALEESGQNSAAESTDSSPLTNSSSETRGSSGIAEGIISSAEIPARPDALISMTSDEFRKKLNSGTLPNGSIIVTGDLRLSDDDALAKLPPGLTVRGGLNLRGCISLTSLPAGLNVGGNLILRGCTSLTSLPLGFHMDGDLDLSGCKSLMSLPARLTVRGRLDLDECTLLTSLPTGLTVGGDVNLRCCTLLTLLPAGLTLGGNLDLYGCTSLTSLPAGLTFSGNLLLSECRSLTSLPAGLTVRGWLVLRHCTLLTSLPAGLTVGGSLDLSYCRSLTSLPAGLTVGGHLSLRGCTSLTSLPNWITELGPRRDGQVREVDLTRTGLSDALIDRLRNLQPPPLGMRFIFSRQATAVEDAFTSIDAAISFWKALVEDALSVSLSLETGEAQNLINFLTRLQETAEYKNLQARPVLAKRICHVLKKMEDEEFKERACLLIHEGLSTCHDRIITALDELDLMLQVKEAEEEGKREELCTLGKSMLMLEEVQNAARAHARTLTWVDEIEIQLAFQIGLKDRLQLPLSTGNMIFRGCAHVSDEQIQQVGAEIERRVSDKVVDDYLLTWAPWQKLLRREAFDALEPELQEAPVDLNWECCLSREELRVGYLYRGQLYSCDSIRRVYVDKGVDPFTKEAIDLAKVKIVVKS